MSTTACLFYVLFLGSSAMVMMMMMMMAMTSVEGNVCNVCEQSHLKETLHIHPGSLFAMNGKAYRLCDAPLPFLNPITIRNHIYAHVVSKIKTVGVNGMWRIKHEHPKVLTDRGSLVFTMAITLFDSILKREKICCRGLVRPRKDSEGMMKNMCGHTKCSALSSKVPCEAWGKVPALSASDFQPCLQLFRQTYHNGEVEEVMVPPYSIGRAKQTKQEKRVEQRFFKNMIHEGFNILPCPDCVHGPHWCEVCREDHLKQVKLMNERNEITANGIKYIIKVPSNPRLSLNTLMDHIHAYANSRMQREPGDIWSIQETHQGAQHEGNLFAAAVMRKNTDPNDKICCRAVARLTGANQRQKEVKCGHPRCSAFVSQDTCFGWKVEVENLPSDMFTHCLHMKASSGAHGSSGSRGQRNEAAGRSVRMNAIHGSVGAPMSSRLKFP